MFGDVYVGLIKRWNVTPYLFNANLSNSSFFVLVVISVDDDRILR